MIDEGRVDGETRTPGADKLRGLGVRSRPAGTAPQYGPGAKEHGIVISERGRIPASIIKQYQAATPAG